MVDLLDRFEREEISERSGGRPRQPLSVNPFDSQDVPAAALQTHHHPVRQYKPPEYPIFKRQEAKFIIPSGITHMVVSNGWVTIVMIGNIIYRFNTSDPRAVEHHEIKREDDRIHKVFQDPTGQHVLVCMESKECHYIRRTAKRTQPRLLPKVRGQLIESVAWNKVDQSETATGPILLGTNSGGIFETDILFEESLLKQRKGYFHELYQLMYDITDHCEPITGLLLEPFPKGVPQSENKYYILATTPKRIYQFIGVSNHAEIPQFADIFTPYKTIKVQFLEIPGNLKDSQLHVWPAQYKAVPKAFAWLTGAGIYYGKLGFGDHEAGESLFLEKTLIPYSPEQHSEFTPPVGMALTQFHCILLYRDRVEAICVLNQKRVFEDLFNVRRDGPLHGMCMDPVKGSVFTYQKFKTWLYTPHMETRNVWKIFLEQGEYEKAKQYSDGNQEHIDTIVIKQAEHYFKQARYQEAAVAFSQSQLSFEEITLKFIGVNRKDALKTFLLRKLSSLRDKDSTQQTMLTTWLVELYLNDLGVLKDEGDKEGHRHLQKEFHKFLQQQQLAECLEANRKTVYDLISSHGAIEDMVFFATLMKDFEKVISHHIQHYEYKEALKVLRSNAEKVLQGPENEQQSKFKRFAGLFYKFSPTLMRHCAPETVDAWIRMGQHLSPKKLIPALIQYNLPTDQQQVKAAIEYLEFCVEKLKTNDRAIHNFLVSFYTKSSDYQKLLNYLKKQAKNVSVSYDPQYALRLCSENHLEEACVHIYAAMGLYEESVDLALKVDVELARTIANSPLRNKDVQKKLWLKVAQHVIKEDEDIEKAMKFLQDCSLLKIEDILPFFPDFVTIDHFKDAICTSLSEYNAHIDDLKAEMQGATDSAKNIRSDIQDIRNKCVTIKADTRCQICEARLLTQAFYMFPCQHAFHRDCLIHEVMPHLSVSEQAFLRKLLLGGGSMPLDTEEGHYSNEDLIKSQIDSIVGGECIYCGDRMVQSVSLPFIDPTQLREALDSWK